MVTTPYGNARVIHATLPSGKEVDFLTRHSVCLQEDAYETNFRANIFALYLCGVTHIISISVMGTCDYSFRLGSFCLISDFIDFTRLRPSSFRMEHRLVRHAGMDDVFDSRMTDVLEKVIEIIDNDNPKHMTPAGVRHISETLLNLKSIKNIRSEEDIAEQRARIAKLQKDAQDDERSKEPIRIIIDDGLSEYAN